MVFRAKHIDRETYCTMARPMVARARAAGAQLLLHDHPGEVERLDVAGVHLSQSAVSALFADQPTKRPLASRYWLCVSCHSLAEIRAAERAGADFCVLGPVKTTPGHTAEAMGFAAFAKLAAQARIPVYALGGLCCEDLPQARISGAQGIAGIRCFSV